MQSGGGEKADITCQQDTNVSKVYLYMVQYTFGYTYKYTHCMPDP